MSFGYNIQYNTHIHWILLKFLVFQKFVITAFLHKMLLLQLSLTIKFVMKIVQISQNPVDVGITKLSPLNGIVQG